MCVYAGDELLDAPSRVYKLSIFLSLQRKLSLPNQSLSFVNTISNACIWCVRHWVK